MYNTHNKSQLNMTSTVPSQVTQNSQERNGRSKNAPFQRRMNGVDDLNKSSTTGTNLTLSSHPGSKPPGVSYNISTPASVSASTSASTSTQNVSAWQKNKDGQENNKSFYWQKNNSLNK